MTRASRRRICSALAIAAYLAVALFTFRNVLTSPSTLLGYPSVVTRPAMITLDHRDQSMVIATIVRNANLLLAEPWNLFADVGQCYPMPAAYTLGEHMFGVGILAAVPYLLTEDPIASYNIVLVLTLWIPAIAMYFLSLRFTRSPAAAFVAGLTFALVPGRLVDPTHPYVHGDLWAPAVLLFLHRLFVGGKWRDALALAFFLNLEVMESLYPLISTCLIAGVYGLYLLFRHRENLGRVLPKLAVALLLVGAGVWIVLGPYLDTGATWGLLSGRKSVLLYKKDFLPGVGEHFPGWIVLFLTAIALLDRLRGPRLAHGEDPRLAFFAGGLLILWCSLGHTKVPGLDVLIASPFLVLREVIPGIQAVRALSSVAIGVGIALAFLSGFAVLALTEKLRPRPWGPIAGTAALALALLVARFVPSVAEATFGRTFQIISYEARPPQENIDLIRRAGRGPQVDVPLGGRPGGRQRLDVADALLLASYDPRPLAACYNSFIAPVNHQVVALSEQLPAPAATEALAGLGFDTVVLDHARAGDAHVARFREMLDDPAAAERLEALGATPHMEAFRIRPRTGTASDFAALRPSEGIDTVEAIMPSTTLEIPVTNTSDETFVHPPPLRPSDLLVRWLDEGGNVVHEEEQRALLPIALGPNGRLPIPLDVTTPNTPGDYRLTLSLASDPEEPLAVQPVHLPRLDEVMAPSKVALHLHYEFVRTELFPIPMTPVFPPAQDVEFLLGPGASSAAELRAHGTLAAHWNNLTPRATTATRVIDADVEPTGVAGRVRIPLEIPVELGPQVVLLTPVDDPWNLLAGVLVFPDTDAVRAAAAEAGREVR